MAERRQAFRRKPIEIDLGGEVILVGPIPWMQRNDFGNEVMRQHSEILNEALQIFVDDENATPRIEAKFADKFTDPIRLFELGLDKETFTQVNAIAGRLYINQIVEILLAICDVNGLERLHPLLDPNSLTPSPVGGMLTQLVEGVDDSLKTESGQDSSSPESSQS